MLWEGESDVGVISRVFWLLSGGVHEAGENVNTEDSAEDSVEIDAKSSESRVGELARVGGMKRALPSRSMFARDWRGASLVQGVSTGS